MGCIYSKSNPSIVDDISNYNITNTNQFSLNNMQLEVRIIDIYDGDTCTCIIPLFNNYYKFTIRLVEIDTCELKSTNSENKELALNARKRLCTLVSDDFLNIDLNIKRKELTNLLNTKCYLIYIKCGDFDKYGRLLAHLYKSNISTISFNQILINEKLAYKYTGKTKLSEEEQVNLFKN